MKDIWKFFLFLVAMMLLLGAMIFSGCACRDNSVKPDYCLNVEKDGKEYWQCYLDKAKVGQSWWDELWNDNGCPDSQTWSGFWSPGNYYPYTGHYTQNIGYYIDENYYYTDIKNYYVLEMPPMPPGLDDPPGSIPEPASFLLIGLGVIVALVPARVKK